MKDIPNCVNCIHGDSYRNWEEYNSSCCVCQRDMKHSMFKYKGNKMTKEIGLKFDDNKPMWNLLPLEPIKEVVKIMTFGAKKYAPNNWKLVEPDRYYSAFFRHWEAYHSGEELDPESGFNHLSHCLCNIVFYVWLKMFKKDNK